MLFVLERTKKVKSEVSKLLMARSARTFTLLDNEMMIPSCEMISSSTFPTLSHPCQRYGVLNSQSM
jgi:hypothetical protein